MNSSGTRLGPLVGPLYCVGVLLVFISLFDYAGTVWPFRMAEVEWRYGAVGLLSGFTLTPLLGALLILATGALAGHRGVLRGMGIVTLILAFALLAVLAGFTLDALQARRGAPSPELQQLTAMSAIKAGVKLLLTTIAMAWLGIAGIRAARRLHPSGDRTPPIVLGG